MKSGWSDVGRLVSLLASRDRTQASRTYDLLSTRYVLGDRSLYLNLGYWDTATTYDEACQALAEELGVFGGLSPGQRVLDVGYGFGDQDMFWADRFGVSIVGLNITASQVARARRRVAARGLSDRVDLLAGSATAMPLPGGGFDRVLALECAFHFVTRADFFCEAFRVLKPGGVLALADMPKRLDGPLAWSHRLFVGTAASLFQIPPANLCTWPEYRRHLERAGFADIRMQSIRELVLKPFWRYLEARLGDTQATAGMSPVLRYLTRRYVRRWEAFEPFDYLLIAAAKPCGGSET